MNTERNSSSRSGRRNTTSRDRRDEYRTRDWDDYDDYDDRPRRTRSGDERRPRRGDDRPRDRRRSGEGSRPRSSSRGAPKKRPRKKRRRSRLGGFIRLVFRICLVLLLMIVVAAAAFKVFVRPPAVNPDPPKNPTTSTQLHQPDVTQGDLQRREGVYNILLAATDKDGQRTDTMMVLNYDVPNKKASVVSVPRDTIYDRGKNKNPRLVYGPGSVQQRCIDISDMLGIPIDYYVKVNLQGFVALVDYVGGVDFYVPCDMDYEDPYQDLFIHFKEGKQHLDGQAAMEVARFRKNNIGSTGGYSDVGRTKTQQQLLLAIAKKVLAWHNITRVNGLVRMVNEYIDTDLKLVDMMWFASQGISLDPASDVETTTLKGRGDAVFRGTSYCYELDREATVETVNRLLNPYVEELTLEHMNLAKAQKYMS